MTMNYFTSYVVRWTSDGADSRIYIFNKFFKHVHKTCKGDVATVPGPGTDQLDFMFELESDASWFILKYNGEFIREPNPPLLYL